MNVLNKMLLKFNQSSLKFRLMLITFIIGLVVGGFSVYAQKINSESSRKNVIKSQNLLKLDESLAKITIILHTLENELYEQVIKVDQDYVETIESTFELLSKEVALVESNKFLGKINPKFNENHTKIYSITKNIRNFISQFNKTTMDINSRYPAMSVVNNHLIPINENINKKLIFSIEYLDRNKPYSKKQNRIKIILLKLQHTWNEQIQSVRLFFSSRSGTYGGAKEMMKVSLDNRDIYISQVYVLLEELKKVDKKTLNSVKIESVSSILALVKEYDKKFLTAKLIHSSDNWRKDVTLLENELQPELDLIWEKVVNIQILIGLESNKILIATQNISNKISNIILFNTLLTLFVLAVIYYVFEISLRRPIVRVAQALNSEAKGEDVNLLGKHYGTEINELLSAFSNMREQVHFRQTRLQSILDNALEGIIITHENGTIQSFNNAIQKLSGYDSSEVVGKNISLLLPWINLPLDSYKANQTLDSNKKNKIGTKIERDIINKDATKLPISIKISEMIINEQKYFTTVIEDISERVTLIKNLQYQANHDSLTGLFNRHYFNLALEKMVDQHVRGDSNRNALIYLDLDNFKYVNDTMGHLAGDQLIKEVASLLQTRMRKSDTLGRIGGDEFSILLYNEKDVQLELVANSFCNVINKFIFKYDGNVVDITCSIGAAYLNKDINKKEDLLSRADFACHEAKRLGRNQVYIYSEKDDEFVSDMSKDIGWTHRIKDALKNDYFLLACQPIYNTSKKSVSYYEVLIRMTDIDGKIIMPFGFLPAAERFGLMLEIDTWVLRNSLKLMSEQHHLNPELKLSINLSSHSIDNSNTFSLIKTEIEKYKIDPTKLLFEVTETIAIANMNTAVDLLKNIQSLGCKTALDDFGVGHSSFAYLADLPVDIVKIDGFFVKDMTTKSLNKTMVRAINDIAHELGKTTVAEFVENAEIFVMLQEMGVDYSQGYYFGKPEIVHDSSKDIRALFNE